MHRRAEVWLYRVYAIGTGRRVTWEPNASSVRNPSEEHRRAANAYLLWPLALANLVNGGDTETIWSRLHARQALVFGLLASLAFLLILAFPVLVVSVLPTITTGATIAVYTAGLIADVSVALVLILLAFRYSARAARGELFAIPVVTPIVDTLFRLKRP